MTLALDIERVSLFLDLDGVLADFEPTPSAVELSPQDIDTLEHLTQRLGGRLAVVSGRQISDADRVTQGRASALIGQNGLQRRAPGREISDPEPHENLDEVVDILSGLARSWNGLAAEEKGLSVALHYRHAAEAEAEVLAIADALARGSGLSLQPDSLVVDLATPGWDKGSALCDLLRHPPFLGSLPIYLGDGLADEPAFKAARESGGIGVHVGAARPTAAQGRIERRDAVIPWLQDALRRGAFDLAV